MSDNFTYLKPDEKKYFHALLKFLEKSDEKDLLDILKDSKCSISISNSFSKKRWNAKRTEIIFYLPIHSFDFIEESIKYRLVKICDTIIPKDAGLDVMDVEFSPDMSDKGPIKTLESDLDDIQNKLYNIGAAFTLPEDILKKGQEMAEVYLYLYAVENFLRLFIEKVTKNVPSAKRADTSTHKTHSSETIHPEKKEIYAVYATALDYFQNVLHESSEGEEALNYLKGRDVPDDFIKNFRIGYAPSGWQNLANHLSNKGVPQTLALKAGLVVEIEESKRFYDRFRSRIIFPTLDTDNQAIRFTGRVIDDSMVKYLNTPDTIIYNKKHTLYGLSTVKNNIKEYEDSLYIVETPFELKDLFTNNIQNAVATLGVDLTCDHIRYMKGLFKKIILVYNSTFYTGHAVRSIKSLLKENIEAGVILLPPGVKPGRYIKENDHGGPFSAKNGIEQHPIPFLINSVIKKHGTSSVEGKINIISDLKEPLAYIKDKISQALYVKELSKIIDLDNAIIQEKINEVYDKISIGNETNIPNYTKFINGEDNIFNRLMLTTEVKKGISLRKRQEEKNRWLSIRGNSELFYLDFKELEAIILNNWTVFKQYFPGQSWISSKIDELVNCRNLVAHNSYIGTHERDVIRINFNSIIRQLSQFIEN